MAKFCKYCGTELSDDALFCANCGAKVEEEIPKYEGKVEDAPKSETYSETPKPANRAGIQERNIALAIIFSFLTCGIYLYYWIYKLNDEINQLAGEKDYTSGGMVIVLTILTCGIYGWYWYYKMGQKVDELNKSGSNSILFIVLAVFGLGIVNLAIMQDAVNSQLH